jgi:hypothetical protein
MDRSNHVRRSERGQTLILFAALFTVMLVVAAFAIDQGVWLGDRRISQKDADVAARAGAIEYLNDVENFPGADLVARRIAERNGADLEHELFEVRTLETCTYYDFATGTEVTIETPSVEVDIGRKTGALFARLFGVSGITVGAQSTACAGSLSSATGLRPWAIPIFPSDCFEWVDANGDGIRTTDEMVPLFGQDCVIRLDDPPSNLGSIRLDLPDPNPGPPDCPQSQQDEGASIYGCNIIYGSGGTYSINDGTPCSELGAEYTCVDTQPGATVGQTLSALRKLLEQEGECDALFGNQDGIDDFHEVLSAVGGGEPEPGPDVTFVRRDCQSPRLADLIIVEYLCDPPTTAPATGEQYCTDTQLQGIQTLPILGFAAFFIEQCERQAQGGGEWQVYPKCDMTGQQGQFRIRGRFINILELGGPLAPMNPFGTKVVQTVR